MWEKVNITGKNTVTGQATACPVTVFGIQNRFAVWLLIQYRVYWLVGKMCIRDRRRAGG